MSKITVLDIHFEHDGMEASFHPVLISDKDTAVLVDSCYEGFLPLIEEAVKDAEEDFSRISAVVLTSSTIDHVGAIPEMIQKYPNISVWASEQERRYLEKEKTPKMVAEILDKTHQAIESFDEPLASFLKMQMDFPAIKVNRVIKSRDYEHVAGGFEILDEQLQTLLYCDEDKLLIAGDVFIVDENEKLALGNIHHRLSIQDILQLLQYLSNFEIEAIACFHGGLFTGDIKESLSNVFEEEKSKLVIETEDISDENVIELGSDSILSIEDLENLKS